MWFSALPGQPEIQIVKLPAQPCKTESEFDAFSINDKRARPCEKRIFYFRPAFRFATRKPELPRILEVLQCSRIRNKRRDSVWRRVGVNDRVDQRWAEISPALLATGRVNEPRDELLLQRCSNSEKIDTRAEGCAIARSHGDRKSPERKIWRRAVDEQKNNPNERYPADKSHSSRCRFVEGDY